MLMQPDFRFGVTPGDVIYDIETYPNVFTCNAKHVATGKRWRFEISPWRNDLWNFCQWLDVLREQGCRMVGFNSIHFDYPVIHYIYHALEAGVSHREIYDKAMSIIRAPDSDRFAHLVWDSKHVVPQIDLFKIHHFDNPSRSTSLKVLEFNMRMSNIEDLPFPVGMELTPEQIEILHTYNDHDVDATELFYNHTLEQIRFREELSAKYDRNFLNHNDTKIGKDYFVMMLEERAPGSCYRKVDGKKKVVQTHRGAIQPSEIILPQVQFEQPEFNRILNWFKSTPIVETKGAFKDVSCTLRGFTFVFGTGGIHGSVSPQVVSSDDRMVVEDWDVASYYPNLAIANGLFPAHLGQTFCTIYKELYDQRKMHAKGTAENAMLKLALNGVYGDSNNIYSPFYDPQYTMSITINGQLLLCVLAEQLMKHADLQMVQINTDGLTVRYPRAIQPWVHEVAKWWEQLTSLELEHVEYANMYIRDVNNYLAVDTKGKTKRKGAYGYVTPLVDPNGAEQGWNKDHSALVVPKAAEAALVHGKDIRDFIMGHDDIMDFMLRGKVPRNSSLEWGGERVANIVRYYVSTDGDVLEKVMPPAGPEGAYKRKNGLLDADYYAIKSQVGDEWDERIHTKNKSTYQWRRTDLQSGWTVQLCSNMEGKTFTDINYEWYVQEASKLVDKILRGTA